MFLKLLKKILLRPGRDFDVDELGKERERERTRKRRKKRNLFSYRERECDDGMVKGKFRLGDRSNSGEYVRERFHLKRTHFIRLNYLN